MVVYDLTEDTELSVTVAILVSTINQEQVNDARNSAATLQEQGVRLVLIGHGDNADPDLLSQVTGDPSVVFSWKVTDNQPPDYKNWFIQVLGCPQ